MRRLFFALWPDDNSRRHIRSLSLSLPLTPRQRVRAQNWHVTLVFLGSTEEALLPQIVHNAAQITAPPCTLVFDKLEYWRGPGILCLSSSKPEPAVMRLVTDLSTPLTELGFKLDKRPYCPHITLARHVRGQAAIELKPLCWHATQFALVESVSESTGVIYQPLHCWPLGEKLAENDLSPTQD